MSRPLRPCALFAFAAATLWLLPPLTLAAQTATIGFSSYYARPLEGRDVAATLSVRRTGDTNSAVTVHYATTGGSYDTATPGLDFLPATGTVAFAPGETNGEISITILSDDVLFEGTEQFEVLLSDPSPGAALGQATWAFVSIEDPTWPLFYDASFALELDPDDDVFALAQQPDGKILVAGAFTGFGDFWYPPFRTSGRVARLHSDGSLDTAFDPGAGANATVYAVAWQTNGQVLIGGSFTSVAGTPRNYLARLNANGSLDTTFAPTLDGELRAIAVQADGSILIGGRFTVVNGQSRGRIARLNADGSLDPSFNPGTGADDNVRTMALESDGRVVLGGDFNSVNGILTGFFARLNADGSLDMSFVAGPGANDEVRAVAVQSDGKVLIGGEFDTVHGVNRGRIARLNTDGSVDQAFKPGTGVAGVVRGLTVQPDGKILLGGGFYSVDGQNRQNLARLNADGSLDARFPARDLRPEIEGLNDEVFAMVVQPDGSILVGGQFFRTNELERTALERVYGDATQAGFVLDSVYGFGTEASSSAGLSVRRLGDLSGNVSVDYETVAGTALPGEDYVEATGTLTFGPGEYLKSASMLILNDDRREPWESFGLKLRNPSAGAVLGVPAAGQVYIEDNDLGFYLTVPASAVYESSGEATIVVSRGPDAVGAATVDFRTEDGTALAGLDYLATNGTLHFAIGERQKAFFVRVLGDGVGEETENLVLRLANPTGSTDLGIRVQATLYIQDTTARLVFESSPASVSEGAAYYYIRVWRLVSGLGPISAQYSTQDGTARAGLDYTTTAGVLTFNEGEFVKTISIPILDDNLAETNETFQIILSHPSPGASVGPPATNVVYLVSNDRGFELGSTNYLVAEAGSNLVVHVVRDGSEFGIASVEYLTTAGTAMAGVDFIATSGTLMFGSNDFVKTFTIPILDDCLAEPDQQFSISLRNPSLGSVLGARRLGLVTILDDDANRRLEFRSLTRTPAGAMTMSLATPGGFTCVLEASTDLRAWQPQATNRATQCTWEVTDLSAVSLPRRFYRARLLGPP